MVGPKTIYVRNDHELMWAQAEAAAENQGGSLSGYVAEALMEKLNRDVAAATTDREIVIEVRPSEDDNSRKQRFRGRWLLSPQIVQEGSLIEFGVAETARGQFLGYVCDTDRGVTRVEIATSLSGLAEVLVPEALAEAAEALGEEYVEDLDI